MPRGRPKKRMINQDNNIIRFSFYDTLRRHLFSGVDNSEFFKSYPRIAEQCKSIEQFISDLKEDREFIKDGMFIDKDDTIFNRMPVIYTLDIGSSTCSLNTVIARFLSGKIPEFTVTGLEFSSKLLDTFNYFPALDLTNDMCDFFIDVFYRNDKNENFIRKILLEDKPNFYAKYVLRSWEMDRYGNKVAPIFEENSLFKVPIISQETLVRFYIKGKEEKDGIIEEAFLFIFKDKEKAVVV